MCAAARASTAGASHKRPFLIDCSAIRNACNFHKNNALAFSNRLKCACSGAVSSPHQPLAANRTPLAHPFLFNTNERTRRKNLTYSQQTRKESLLDTNEQTRKNLTYSQQRRKQFLFNTFQRSTGFLFDTFERSLPCPHHFEILQYPPATVELRPYD
jgi:hypothetical protein